MVAAELSKIVMVTINVIFLLFGLAALIVGIIFKVGWDDVRDAFIDKAADVDIDLQSAGDTLAYGAIVLGSLIVLIAFLGCIGACCNVKVMLAIYAIIILLLFIGEIVVVALVAIKGDEAKDAIYDVMKESLVDYHEDYADNNDVSKAFSTLFSTLECCALRNYSEDFTLSGGGVGFKYSSKRPGQYQNANSIPITCCKSIDYERDLKDTDFTSKSACLNVATRSSSNAYLDGCEDAIINLVKDNKAIVIGVGAAILVLEILMVIMAFFLCCRNDD